MYGNDVNNSELRNIDDPRGHGGGGPGSSISQGSPMALGGWEAVFSGLMSYLGQQSANSANKQMARDANALEKYMAEQQMGFQANMSNTAYQRQMEDMRKAGLNPLLAAGMSGASTPSGASGSAHTAKMENALGAGISSAQGAALTKIAMVKGAAELGIMGEQGKLIQSQNANTKADTVKKGVESQVLSKGIPEADLKNKIYNAVKKSMEMVPGAIRSIQPNIRLGGPK